MPRRKAFDLSSFRKALQKANLPKAFPQALPPKPGSMASKIDIAALRARLFPQGHHAVGKKPNPALPIDDFVAELKQVDKLRPDLLLAEYHSIACPYLIARTYVFRAFDIACADERYGQWDREQTQAALQQSKATEHELQILLARRENGPGFLSLSSSLIKALREAIAESQKESSEFERRLKRMPNRKGDVWGIRFAQVLGYAWADLTAKSPAWTMGKDRKLLFVNFVRAAYRSGGPLPRREWHRQCRTAIERENEKSMEKRWNFREMIREHPVLRHSSRDGNGRKGE